MFIAFNELPDQARVWIFQADKIMESEIKAFIEEKLMSFTSSWAAHGQPLQSSYLLLDDYFIVLAVDENMNAASGCSIDQATDAIKHIANATGLDFFNRKIVSFEIDQKVKQFDLKDLRQKFKERVLSKNTIIFNTLVDTAGALRQYWRIPVQESWVKRYIEPVAFDSVN